MYILISAHRYREIKFGALLDRLPLSESIPERAWFATGTLIRLCT